MRLSEYLKEYLDKNNISGRQLAKMLDTSQTQVFLMLEDASLPKIETLKRLSEVTGTPLNKLKAMTYKEVDGEYKTYLTDEEIKARKIK